MPLESEKRKEFKDIEGMGPAAPMPTPSMPPVVQYGMETHGDVMVRSQRVEQMKAAMDKSERRQYAEKLKVKK